MLFATYHNHKNSKTDAKSLYSKRFKVKKHAYLLLITITKTAKQTLKVLYSKLLLQ